MRLRASGVGMLQGNCAIQHKFPSVVAAADSRSNWREPIIVYQAADRDSCSCCNQRSLSNNRFIVEDARYSAVACWDSERFRGRLLPTFTTCSLHDFACLHLKCCAYLTISTPPASLLQLACADPGSQDAEAMHP